MEAHDFLFVILLQVIIPVPSFKIRMYWMIIDSFLVYDYFLTTKYYFLKK